MARQVYFSAWPTDVCGFIYNAVGNLHRGTDAAHSIATLHYLLRNNMMEDAKRWYQNWKHHIPACELSHDQLMLLDDEYRLKHTARQTITELANNIKMEDVMGLVGALLQGLQQSNRTEQQPEPERNHRPKARATMG